MERRENIERMKKMAEEMRQGKKPETKKKASKKKPSKAADVNNDGKVDQQDVEAVEKEIVSSED